jgi:hypothetical protein
MKRMYYPKIIKIRRFESVRLNRQHSNCDSY